MGSAIKIVLIIGITFTSTNAFAGTTFRGLKDKLIIIQWQELEKIRAAREASQKVLSKEDLRKQKEQADEVLKKYGAMVFSSSVVIETMNSQDLKNLQTKKKRRSYEEADEQMAFVAYVRLKYPDLPMWISPIFKLAGNAKQQMITAMLRKRMGYTKGTPDVTFLFNRKCYSGLVFEFKKRGEKATPEQEHVLDHCRKNGKSVHLVYSAADAIAIFDWYMFQPGGENGSSKVD